MRIDGILKTWNDDRGFGFIGPAQGGQEIFVHIKAFPSGSGRPTAGQAVTFEVETGPNGKKRAHSLQYPVRARVRRPMRSESPAPWTIPRLLIIPAFAVLYYYVAVHWAVKPWIPIAYIALSLLAFLAYALDKSAAISRRWRIAETKLHLIGLAGGWPGALLAQQLLRHKSNKPNFIATYWATVLFNVAVFVGWHTGLLNLALA